MKGRDVFGLLAILPGVQDTNLNRDFAQWRSAISITINGMPSQNKDVRVDGINIVDEGGCGTAFVNLNMDAIGEVQVIANGYTAENGRNNGGLISVVTKSGTSTLKASGWYNGRRDQFNENDYFRKVARPGQAALSGQHLRLQRRRPGRDSRDWSTAAAARRAARSSTSSSRRNTPTMRGRRRPRRANMPTALEQAGDFSQTRITNGTIQPIIDPRTGAAFPGNIIPADRINPLGPEDAQPAAARPTASSNPRSGQEWTSNSAFDLTPVHGRTNHVLRMDAVLTDKTRFNFKVDEGPGR